MVPHQTTTHLFFLDSLMLTKGTSLQFTSFRQHLTKSLYPWAAIKATVTLLHLGLPFCNSQLPPVVLLELLSPINTCYPLFKRQHSGESLWTPSIFKHTPMSWMGRIPWLGCSPAALPLWEPWETATATAAVFKQKHPHPTGHMQSCAGTNTDSA